MIVLDTNVVSELMAKSPDSAVMSAVDQLVQTPALTVISVAEIRFGIAVLPDGSRKRRLERAAEGAFAMIGSARILPFDAAASVAYAGVSATRRAAGRPISQFDAMIAAICHVHEATLMTRNVNDFAGTGITVIDPWVG